MSTTNKTVSLLAIPILVFSLSNCTSSTESEKVDKAAEEVEDARLELERANEKFEEEVSSYRSSKLEDLQNNEFEIAKLKEQNLDSKGAVNPSKSAKIDVLESRNKEFKMRIKEFQSKDKEEWEAFKKEFNSDLEAWQKESQDIKAEKK